LTRINAIRRIRCYVVSDHQITDQETDMITRRDVLAGSAATMLASSSIGTVSSEEAPARITTLFEAFGKPSNLRRGWGYASLIEYGGRRILFDTGGRVADFAYNIDALGIDLKRLDFVVISHRHNDHTAGINLVLRENPTVRIYTPAEPAGFNAPVSPSNIKMIKRDIPSLPDEMRYFDGNPPAGLRSDSAWPEANFVPIRATTEVLPGFFLFSLQSDAPGSREVNEISLAIRTPKGSVLVVGCAHPGIERIVEAASKIDPRIYSVFGGLHLSDAPDAEVTAMVAALHDKWHIERLAAGHCSGGFAFAEMIRVFGANFDIPGVGSVIPLPTPVG
jgi:7,8-dihydropterin-6-yl-methyl-4-(beta-D-ribofuranosyl)aminobenzene 5'-phosphate synthase